MVRPKLNRFVSASPAVRHFKPQGIPLSALEEVVLTEDELEALRLADVEGLYQDEAARRMNVSRPTFGRIIVKARRTLATAITQGKAICVQRGSVEYVSSPCGLGRGWGQGRGRCRRGWGRW